MVVDLCGILFDEGILRARNAGEGKGGGKVYIMGEGGKLWVGWGAFGALNQVTSTSLSSSYIILLLILKIIDRESSGH